MKEEKEHKKEKEQKEEKEKKFRLLKNPKQTNEVQIYFDQDHVAVNVPKDGYHFSTDKSMDKTIAFLKQEYGFVEV